MAERLLARYGSLTAVLSEPSEALAITTGSPVLAGILSTAKNMVLESLLAELPKTPFSSSSQHVVNYITTMMSGLTHEEAHVFFLDGRLRFLRHEIFAYGSETEATFPVQTILRRAVMIGASQLVLAHNHPSGSPEPSEQDKRITRDIATVARAIGIEVHDHLVVAGPHVFSLRAAGML